MKKLLPLFTTNNIDDIALGLEVVKRLGFEREFEVYFKITLSKYEDVFNKMIIPFSKEPKMKYALDSLLKNDLNLDKVRSLEKVEMIQFNADFINYFDTKKMYDEDFLNIVAVHPHLIDKFDLSKMCNDDIVARVLSYHPHLEDKFNFKLLSLELDNENLFKDYPHLKKWFKLKEIGY